MGRSLGAGAAEANAEGHGMSGQVRVVVVVDWLHRRVHGITCNDEEAQEWVRDVVSEHGDLLAATMTVGLVSPTDDDRCTEQKE